MLTHYSHVATLDKAVHCLTFEAETSSLVHIVVLALVEALGQVLELVFCDAIPIVDYVEAFSAIVEETNLDLLGIHLKGVLQELTNPDSELRIQVVHTDV